MMTTSYSVLYEKDGSYYAQSFLASDETAALTAATKFGNLLAMAEYGKPLRVIQPARTVEEHITERMWKPNA